MKRIYFILLIALTGCGMDMGYSCKIDSVRPVSVFAHGVTLKKVNGQEISSWSRGAMALPGKNTMELTINPGNYHSMADDKEVYVLEADLEEGKDYIVTSQLGSSATCAYAKDETTGQPDFSKSYGCATRR